MKQKFSTANATGTYTSRWLTVKFMLREFYFHERRTLNLLKSFRGHKTGPFCSLFVEGGPEQKECGTVKKPWGLICSPRSASALTFLPLHFLIKFQDWKIWSPRSLPEVSGFKGKRHSKELLSHSIIRLAPQYQD